MEHISIEEIINYITVTELNNETSDLLARVNGHIRKCSACKEKLRAFEMVNDAFLGDRFEIYSEIGNETEEMNR